MKVIFEKEYLRDLYTKGKSSDKKYRFQPQIIRKFSWVIDLMIGMRNVNSLSQYGSLHYEHLRGDKDGISSVRINDQYRIEFREEEEDGHSIATICRIIELSNHYK